MKQWFIKNFRKKKAVRVYILTIDGRMKHYWLLPRVSNTVKMGDTTYKLTKDGYYYLNRIPVYFYNETDPAPIEMATGQVSKLSPNEFDTAMTTHVARDVLKATEKGSISMETILILGAILLAAVGLAYYLSEEINTIVEMLRQLGVGS